MWRTKLIVIAFAASVCACGSQTDKAEADISALLHKTFDRADAPLTAEPIAVSGDHAVADWTQGGTGGRALLHRTDGIWKIVLCSGEPLKAPPGLERAGVPANDAATIARELAREEKSVSVERLAAMARFQGEIRME